MVEQVVWSMCAWVFVWASISAERLPMGLSSESFGEAMYILGANHDKPRLLLGLIARIMDLPM